VTEMRPDPDSELAGEESEYGDDTGFAAQATREPDTDRDLADSAGLTAEDDHIGDGAD
jgi:hypothetical protein